MRNGALQGCTCERLPQRPFPLPAARTTSEPHTENKAPLAPIQVSPILRTKIPQHQKWTALTSKKAYNTIIDLTYTNEVFKYPKISDEKYNPQPAYPE